MMCVFCTQMSQSSLMTKLAVVAPPPMHQRGQKKRMVHTYLSGYHQENRWRRSCARLPAQPDRATQIDFSQLDSGRL